MANGWTAARGAKQARAIERWRRWTRSTGPRTAHGKGISSTNAFGGGARPLLRRFARELRELDDVLNGSFGKNSRGMSERSVVVRSRNRVDASCSTARTATRGGLAV